MGEFILNFYNSYTLVFYILFLWFVIIEWPITILVLSWFAPTIGMWVISIYIMAFLWEFLWDILHYMFGRLFKINICKNKNFHIFEKIEKKIEHYSLFDQIAVIKYIPPITSIWLIYLWFQKINVKKFLKNVSIFALINSFIFTFIWYFFWKYVSSEQNLKYIIVWLLLAILCLYILVKTIKTYLVTHILNEK